MQNPNPQVDPNNPQPMPATPNPGPARTPTPPEDPQRDVPPGVPSPLPEQVPGPEPIGVPPTTPTEIPATPTTPEPTAWSVLLQEPAFPDHLSMRLGMSSSARQLTSADDRYPMHKPGA